VRARPPWPRAWGVAPLCASACTNGTSAPSSPPVSRSTATTAVLPVVARRPARRALEIRVRDAMDVERRRHAVHVDARDRPRRAARRDGAGLPEQRPGGPGSAARARRRRCWRPRPRPTSARLLPRVLGQSPSKFRTGPVSVGRGAVPAHGGVRHVDGAPERREGPGDGGRRPKRQKHLVLCTSSEAVTFKI
jgi:hypothetical protein